MKGWDSKILFFLLVPLLLLGFFFVRDNFIYPYLDVKRLNSSAYVEEIKSIAGNYQDVKNQVIWNSKVLTVKPPSIEISKQNYQVLAADPNTWIEVNLSTQTLCLHHSGGNDCFTVSTGLPGTPTPTGEFSIWIKLPSTKMSGPGYYLPGVPWTMYFYKGYGIHGTYWHNNFGRPMSHGCVNMRTPEAQYVYDRVSVGTKVVVHY